MDQRTRMMVITAMVATVVAFASYRVSAQRSACIASGGAYDLASLTCTPKARPIILQRGILRS